MALNKKMVVGSNWKIYISSIDDAVEYMKILKKEMSSYRTDLVDAYVLPDLGNLVPVIQEKKDYPIFIGTQNVFWEDSGPYTGELSPKVLSGLGGKYVFLGHSERRIFFGETDENVNKKAIACYRNNLVPVILIGETLEEREDGRSEEMIRNQVNICLDGIPADFMSTLVIVYEPRWAIGQKESAPNEVIEESHRIVRDAISNKYNRETSAATRIIYGGSVNLDNSAEIIKIKDVDGLAITRASLDPEDFIKFVRLVEEEAIIRSRG